MSLWANLDGTSGSTDPMFFNSQSIQFLPQSPPRRVQTASQGEKDNISRISPISQEVGNANIPEAPNVGASKNYADLIQALNKVISMNSSPTLSLDGLIGSEITDFLKMDGSTPEYTQKLKQLVDHFQKRTYDLITERVEINKQIEEIKRDLALLNDKVLQSKQRSDFFEGQYTKNNVGQLMRQKDQQDKKIKGLVSQIEALQKHNLYLTNMVDRFKINVANDTEPRLFDINYDMKKKDQKIAALKREIAELRKTINTKDGENKSLLAMMNKSRKTEEQLIGRERQRADKIIRKEIENTVSMYELKIHNLMQQQDKFNECISSLETANKKLLASNEELSKYAKASESIQFDQAAIDELRDAVRKLELENSALKTKLVAESAKKANFAFNEAIAANDQFKESIEVNGNPDTSQLLPKQNEDLEELLELQKLNNQLELKCKSLEEDLEASKEETSRVVNQLKEIQNQSNEALADTKDSNVQLENKCDALSKEIADLQERLEAASKQQVEFNENIFNALSEINCSNLTPDLLGECYSQIQHLQKCNDINLVMQEYPEVVNNLISLISRYFALNANSGPVRQDETLVVENFDAVLQFELNRLGALRKAMELDNIVSSNKTSDFERGSVSGRLEILEEFYRFVANLVLIAHTEVQPEDAKALYLDLTKKNIANEMKTQLLIRDNIQEQFDLLAFANKAHASSEQLTENELKLGIILRHLVTALTRFIELKLKELGSLRELIISMRSSPSVRTVARRKLNAEERLTGGDITDSIAELLEEKQKQLLRISEDINSQILADSRQDRGPMQDKDRHLAVLPGLILEGIYVISGITESQSDRLMADITRALEVPQALPQYNARDLYATSTAQSVEFEVIAMLVDLLSVSAKPKRAGQLELSGSSSLNVSKDLDEIARRIRTIERNISEKR